MSNNTVVPISLDEFFQTTPIGSIEKSIGNNLYGINHRMIAGAVPSNKDSYGLTFFVRPQLNLQSDNVRNVRQLYPLLTTNHNSIQTFVRTTLDPRLGGGYSGIGRRIAEIHSPYMDDLNAFIPVLTNNLKALSGWPDMTLDTFSSKSGLYKEVYSQVDSTVKNFEAFDVNATFRNTLGDPIIYMFYVWLWYQSMVFEGLMAPYPDFLIENRIDYNSRIYRLILDPTKQKLRKIAACGVCFPLNVPMGEFFDFNSEQPFNDQTKDFTIRFRCLGAVYQDDILINEFNKTVQIFNPGMRDQYRDGGMVKIDHSLLPYFNNRGYPRINPETYDLEWYVTADLFESRTSVLLDRTLTSAEKLNNLQIGD